MDGTLIFLLYRAIQWAGSPFLLLYFLLRCLKDRRYLGRFHQRLGFLPHSYQQTVPGAVWLHAVSVGEVLSSLELLRCVRERLPATPLFVSTTTLAGMALAEDRLKQVAEGVFFAPIDYCFAVRRVLRILRPSMLVIAETEIWPNLYREAKRAGCALLVVNGRISDRAAPRYHRFRWFFRHVLALPDLILVQSEVSRRRYLALGAPYEKVELGGNLKYDFEPAAAKAPEAVSRFLSSLSPVSVWIAASTMPPAVAGDPDEDDVVIEAFRKLAPVDPRLLLILVPRRPERFEEAARKLGQAGVPFLRRSALEAGPAPFRLPGVLLLDSVGELSGLFAIADLVFMGGTLPHRGGHNILEPAFFGRAVIAGPHMENFPDIAEEFTKAGALVRIRSAADLAAAVQALLGDGALRAKIGGRARELAESKRGAAARAAREIELLHAHAIPVFRPAAPLHQLLWLLAKLWAAGGRWKQRRDLKRREKLEAPVVSVGGLTVGGAGKTPFVLWLAARLHEAGVRPAILTRGYRRRAPEKHTVLEAGAQVSAARTGDEAQMFLRSGLAPVGIGADRARTGRILFDLYHPDALLLDDGFQHWRLERALDIVLVDALDPFGGGALFPLGRLREPTAALARAGALVITRAEPGRPLAGIEGVLRQRNPHAPVFAARVVPEAWVDCASGREWPPLDMPFDRALAFCGLATPGSFWHTLRALGVHPVERVAFGDHHHYRPVELKRLAARARAAGAEALITTQKDVMNLPAGAAGWVEPLRLCWLRIGLEVSDQEELLRLVRERLWTPGRRKAPAGS